MKHEADRGAVWSEEERREHRAVVPAVMRFLHERLVQYHHSFADAVNVPASVLAEIVSAYFTLFHVANQFADAAQVTRVKLPELGV